ncbi:MAG: GHKL domain-containing protein [Lachnospiraceae bacterium]|nr:GHKL domain-containing protein [Lachnospiraceae bacterium]
MNGFSDYNSLSALFELLCVFFCAYIIAKPALRISTTVLVLDCAVFSLACVPAMSLIQTHTFLIDNRALLVFFAIYFPIFFFSVDLTPARSLTVYLWAVVLMMFPANITSLIDAAAHPKHVTMSFGVNEFTMHLVLNIALCLYAYFVVAKWDSRIFSPHYTPESLWMGWLSVPILFLGLNIAMLPNDYRVLHAYSQYGTYLFFSVSLFVLYAYLTSIFYSYLLEYIHISEYKEAQRLSDIQSLQYKSLLSQIESDRHARHDFKHTLHLLSQLAASGDTEGLRSYIREYAKESAGTIMQKYCKNPAINAVLNYYETRAAEEGVIASLQVDLPRPLPMSDPEFCSLLGNIMENAIDAAKDAPVAARKFSISIRIQNDSMLYIVSSNSYDGELILDTTGENPTFSSKKEKHHGIGLQSIRETVDKYNGTLRISTTDSEFFLDIAIGI